MLLAQSWVEFFMSSSWTLSTILVWWLLECVIPWISSFMVWYNRVHIGQLRLWAFLAVMYALFYNAFLRPLRLHHIFFVFSRCLFTKWVIAVFHSLSPCTHRDHLVDLRICFFLQGQKSRNTKDILISTRCLPPMAFRRNHDKKFIIVSLH